LFKNGYKGGPIIGTDARKWRETREVAREKVARKCPTLGDKCVETRRGMFGDKGCLTK